MNEPKPGKKTSEFWVAMAPWILCLVVLIGVVVGTVDTEFALIALGALGVGGGISSHGYSRSRASIKK